MDGVGSSSNQVEEAIGPVLASYETWTQTPIRQTEDLGDAVRGADLEAIQLSSAPLIASFAHAESDGIVYSSGWIDSAVAFRGPLSQEAVTFGLGLAIGPGARHWHQEVHAGSLGVFLPADDHDSFYTPGSLYATVSIGLERLEAMAADHELVLDRQTLGGTGFRERLVAFDQLAPILRGLLGIHRGECPHRRRTMAYGASMLRLSIQHLARHPRITPGPRNPHARTRIIARARDYIEAHLDGPLAGDELARASGTSRRTLHRVFAEVLDETPGSYIRKLRLHRIRRDLATPAERAVTVAMVAHRWGVGECGRLAGSYRAHYGELPSETLARSRATTS